MALYFSALDDDFGDDRPHFSLSRTFHLKTYRIWMFALMKDQPNATERDHIVNCDPCGRAFRSALGISGYTHAAKPKREEDKPQPETGEGNETSRAVA
jgi:hypothetical protein